MKRAWPLSASRPVTQSAAGGGGVAPATRAGGRGTGPPPRLKASSRVTDPGLTPLSLLELLKRRGRYRPEDFSRLQLAVPFDLPAAREEWMAALGDADRFVRERPPDEYGCLYYSPAGRRFVVPKAGIIMADQGLVPHFGAPGGVIPRMADSRFG